MKCYEEQGVCTNPIICNGRYWHQHHETRNCVLRVEREYELKEIALSIGISKQAVHKLEKRALAKVSAILEEIGYTVRHNH